MAEYIEREAAYREICSDESMSGYEKAYCSELIRNIPAADVAPVRHGRWDSSGKYRFIDNSVAVRCTECGCSLAEPEYRRYVWNYCPICGARMDLEVSDGKS